MTIDVDTQQSEAEVTPEEILVADTAVVSQLYAALENGEDITAEEEVDVIPAVDVEEEILPLENSDYISEKPNTVENKSLGEVVSQNSLFDISPIDESILGLSQVGQLNDLGSLFFTLNSSSFLQGAGLYLFDSFIGRFGSGTSFDYLENDVSKFEQGRSSYSAPVTSTGNGIVYNEIFGNDANDTIIGTAGADLIRGNSLSASPAISLQNTFLSASADNYYYGGSVELSGNNLIVGALDNNSSVAYDGAAYIYDATTGVLLHTLVNPVPLEGDRFGTAVAIGGNYAIVTDPYNDTGATNSGVAYVYDVTTGALLHTLNNPTPALGDFFGTGFSNNHVVAIDGNYAIIGNLRDDIGASNSGVAYIFDLTTGLVVHTLNNPSVAANDYFGMAVAIEGNIAVVGAPNDDGVASDSGAIHFFNVTTGGFIRTINSPIISSTYFGSGLDIDGNNLLVGAQGFVGNDESRGGVFLYDLTTGAFIQQYDPYVESNGSAFGESVAISGNYAVVGAPYDLYDTDGAVHVYDLTTGQVIHTIGVFDGAAGVSVDIEGNNLVMGVPNEFVVSPDGNGAVLSYQLDFGDADALYGGDGDDILYGLLGNDIINGQGGFDRLYGGDGADRFTFDAATVFDAIDRIEDFNADQGDIIDISNVLIGFDYNTDLISDFARFVDVGGDTTLEIDTDGLVGGVNFQAAVLIVGGAGLNFNDLRNVGQIDGTV